MFLFINLIKHIVEDEDPFVFADCMTKMSEYNLIHERFNGEISTKDGKFVVHGTEIKIYTKKDSSQIPSRQLSVEYIFESAGVFTAIDECQLHLYAVTKNIVTAVPSVTAPMLVKRVNRDKYTGKETLVSNVSCTTNRLALLVKAVHEKFGFAEALLTIVHSYTDTQDSIGGLSNTSWYDAHGTAQYVIPSSTGAIEKWNDEDGMGKFNPLAIESENILFGYHTLAKGWKDRILTTMLRKANRNCHTSWICFDSIISRAWSDLLPSILEKELS
ncbi:unnamed protein product [Rotaria sp. Silwood2]|nr:unnamed protein product [Rotaria sp. Silwood2]CAF4187776.1 unnamed protein product [Rotaria sp. Silwood2]